jgi:NCAIR mutase (PurE)-related protein
VLESLRALFEAVRAGTLSPEAAERQALDHSLHTAVENLGFARVDHQRADRQGFPEVIYGQGKTPEQVAGIAKAIADRRHSLLVTRTNEAAFSAVAKVVPGVRFHEQARIIERRRSRPEAGVSCW